MIVRVYINIINVYMIKLNDNAYQRIKKNNHSYRDEVFLVCSLRGKTF